MTAQVPEIKLNNGVNMPTLGLGVYLSLPQDTVGAVSHAIHSGYRLIDTAKAYHNEAQVGEAIANSSVPRTELFITTKLFNSDYGYDSALKAFDLSLAKLGLDYVDLYLLHWPTKNWKATLDSYRAVERILAEGRARAIGVCNFLPDQLDALLAESDIVPAVNQIELHPYFSQSLLRQKNKSLGIVTEAWSPIGGVKNYGNWDTHGGSKDVLSDPTVTAIAQAHGKSAAQVVLRWHLQNDVVPIPKSINAARIEANIDVFDFVLDAAQMRQLDTLDTGIRIGPDPLEVDTTSFPDGAK